MADLELELNKLMHSIIHVGSRCCGKQRIIKKCVRVYKLIEQEKQNNSYPKVILEDLEHQFEKLISKIGLNLKLLKDVINDNKST